jgi:hypothetical protein
MAVNPHKKRKKPDTRPWITVRIEHAQVEDEGFELRVDHLTLRFRDAEGAGRALDALKGAADLGDMETRVRERMDENFTARAAPPAPRPKEADHEQS